ncbi:MAG: tetratricopeptide repeat protein [Isosphaeraceae bacterium]|nr:tetratricopeptide repeat protein [Isosphaeraceae bacterium]
MRRRLNGKLLALLLVAVALLGAGVHILHGFQVRRNASDLLRQAKRAEAQGHLDQAVGFLEQYLAFEPSDTTALAKYGLMLDELAATPQAHLRAFWVLDQVLRRAPERLEVRRRLVQIAMDLGRLSDARQHLEVLLQHAPEDGELEYRLGRCFEGEGQFNAARYWYEKSIRHTPDRIESYVSLAGLLRRRFDQAARADQVMDALIAANERSFRAYLARRRYRQEFQLDGAAADAARARELAPDEADTLLAAAEAARDRGELDTARRDLEHGVALYPRDGRLYQALADLDLRAGRPDQAVARLRKGLAVLPEAVDLHVALVDALLQGGQPTEASAVITSLRQREGLPSALLDFFDARIHLAHEHWSQAAEILERTRPLLVAWPAMARQADLLLAQCFEQLGDPERRIEACRRVVAADSSDGPARLALGSALWAAGRIDEALGEFRQAMTLHDAPAVGWTMLAQALIAHNLRLPPDRRHWPEVEQALNQAAEARPAAVEVLILRADALIAQGQLDRARHLLEQARERQPDRIELWAASALVAEHQRQPAEALSLLDQAQQRLGDTVELRLARCGYWTRHPGDEAREALASLSQDLANFADKDRDRLLEGLAGAYSRLGEPQAAAQLWGQLAERRPNDVRVRVLWFEAALRGGDEAAMRRALDDLRRLEGEDGALWRYGEAAQLIALVERAAGAKPGAAAPRLDAAARQRLGQARARLDEVAQRRPAWSRVPLLAAAIAELEGDQAQAIEHYQRTLDLGDRQPQVIRRLVRLLYEHHRYDEADQALGMLSEQAPLPDDLKRLAAAISLHTQDPEHALQRAHAAGLAQSPDYRDHVWLGQLLEASGPGRHAAAEAELRRAVMMAEDAPDPWVALVQFLARTGQKPQAEAALREAQRKLPPGQAPLALARCYEAIGQGAQAEQQYRAALAARPDDVATLRGAAAFYLRTGQLLKAEPPLRRLLDPQTKAPAQEVAWARRSLAAVLAGGNDRQFQEALALIERNLQAGGATIPDQRARAMVLATRPDRRREAIRLLEDQEGNQRLPLTPNEQFLLARLYEGERDWPKARERMLSLLAAHADNPLYLASYISSLLRRGQADEAQLWLLKLERLEPQAFRTMSLKARMLAARGEGAAAVALLKDYIRDQGAPLLGPIAALLDQIGQAAAAEELYRQYAAQSKQPESTLALAQYLARQGRLREALDLCERAWQTCPPAAVANACIAALYAAQPDDESYQRVERWLETALRKAPGTASLLVPLAVIRGLQRRYQEAEALYRQVIARDDRNIEALNNLAWLLSLKGDGGSEPLELIQRAIAIGGPVPALLDTRAVINLKRNNIDAALQDLRQAVAEAPTASSYFHLAQAYWTAKSPGAAAEALREAKNLGLATNGLDPLERTAYHQLLSALDQR